MDPLSALSIAAAVVQFVDFATRICKRVKGMVDSSTPGAFQQMSFSVAAADLVEFQEVFVNRKKFAGAAADALRENDKAMDAIVDACMPLATRLIDALQSMRPLQCSLETETRKEETPLVRQAVNKLIRSLKQAWARTGIDTEALMDQLDKLQSQLVLRMLHHLNSIITEETSQQMDRYDTLRGNQSRIVEVLAVSEEKLDHVRKQGDDLRRQLMLNETRARTRDEKIVAAILTLKNGETRFLGSDTVDDSSDMRRHGSLVALKTNPSTDRPETIVRDFSGISGVQSKVLDCLYFRQQMDRYETVNTAHQKTYEWVASDGAPGDAPWSPLVTWLESGDGCYWISGKAGSGKSTLMKYICHDKRTKTALNKWAGPGSQLGIARFFFWNLGTELQKSHAGLLRSLIYDILSERPYLMSVVMPELLRTALTLSDHTPLAPPSYPELLRWFRALIQHAAPSFRLVFLIDGIDEYEGSHRDLTDLIKTSARNKNVKFLISSRPIPVCVDAFGRCPCLHLHDLTRNDIRRYAEDHLVEALTNRQLVEWDKLIEEIVDKSSGVFLWVVLVCRSLREGLQNFDTIAELRQRLEELPSDLQALYLHMLGKVPAGYRRHASEFFQIVLLANEIQATDFGLSPIQLYFAVQDEQACLTCPITAPLGRQELEVKMAEIDGRIRSRSMGLLETKRIPREKYNRHAPGPVQILSVDLIHKTAVEFLRTPEVWSDLISYTSEVQFSPANNLLRSCLHMCKTQRPEEVIQFEDNVAWIMIECALKYASLAEDTAHPIPQKYLCELNKAADVHWGASPKCLRGHQRIHRHGHWAEGYFTSGVTRPTVIVPLGFDSVMAFWGITSFFTHTTQLHSVRPPVPACESLIPQRATQLLQHLIFYLLDPDSDPHDEKRSSLQLRRARICIFFLSSGANPNEPAPGSGGLSPWEQLLHHAVECSKDKPQFIASFLGSKFAYTFSRLLASFVTHGADPNACCVQDGKALSVLDVMERLYSPITSHTFVAVPDDPFFNEPLEDATPAPGAADIAKFRDYFVSLLVGKGARRHESPVTLVPGSDGETPAGDKKSLRRKSRVVLKKLSGFFKVSSLA